MKWIGDSFADFNAYFREQVFIESLPDADATASRFVIADATTGELKYRTVSGMIADLGIGDITGVTLAGDSGEASDTSGNANLTIAGGNAITTVGDSATITINHDDTSSQATVNNSGRTFIQDITLDTYGHVTGITSATDSDTHVGDITGVTIQTDSGSGAKASDTAGSADFTLTGGSGCEVINDGTDIVVKPYHFFEFKGYGTSDGTNYEMPQIMSDQNAPFELDTSTGSDGLTAQTTNHMVRMGGHVMPYDGVLKKWIGWSTSAGSGTVDVGIFKVTPTRNDATNLTPVLLKNHQYTALGNTKMEDILETSFSVAFSAGDILYLAVKGGTSSKLQYVNTMLAVQFA